MTSVSRMSSSNERQSSPEEQEFREAMSSFPTGVTVVTTFHEGVPYGMTLNALTSVSLDPRLLLVCLSSTSRTSRAVIDRGMFRVNLLAENQAAVSREFARRGADHFADRGCSLDEHHLPELPGTLGSIVCEVDAVHRGGDHKIVIGRVLSCQVRPGSPLLFFSGSYGRCTLVA
ncbi:flavin reductase family protein [Actinomadura soli]|uniref:Flavin reductase family protein n=1 Tax=Actinomadura soli TaxID=2508997 RepID=A0A5C4JHH9_9ACTN|nr:flavin reductase family protein [Actinomadura soli]TMR04933.1 flavin reductase family protein [Actinomadura soli]